MELNVSRNAKERRTRADLTVSSRRQLSLPARKSKLPKAKVAKEKVVEHGKLAGRPIEIISKINEMCENQKVKS
jgi:hypothetical protein